MIGSSARTFNDDKALGNTDYRQDKQRCLMHTQNELLTGFLLVSPPALLPPAADVLPATVAPPTSILSGSSQQQLYVLSLHF